MFLAYLIVYVFIHFLNRDVGINQACGRAE